MRFMGRKNVGYSQLVNHVLFYHEKESEPVYRQLYDEVVATENDYTDEEGYYLYHNRVEELR